jgi:1,4-dihydroxy-6-naphthoate synthase
MLEQNPLEIVSAHSPDSDDAFMFYGLATKKVRSPLITFRHVLSDIETLNRKAIDGVYHLSAISYHAYPFVADKYVLMASGSSVGDGYGPLVVATHPMEPEDIKGKKIQDSRHSTERLCRCRPDYSRSAIDLQQGRLPPCSRHGEVVEG